MAHSEIPADLFAFAPRRPDVLWLYEQIAEALRSEAYDVTCTPEMTASYLAVVLTERRYVAATTPNQEPPEV